MKGFEIGGIKSFDLQKFLLENRLSLLFALLGLVALLIGIFLWKGNFLSQDRIEVLESATQGQEAGFVAVEVAGQIINPGVYKLTKGARVDDALIAAGGLASEADREWVEKNLNRAAKLTDGQKIYIPVINQQSQMVSANSLGVYQSSIPGRGSGLVDINSATQFELEALPGIGPVYAQKIIEQRPYSNIEELHSRKIIPVSTFNKMKDQISVY